MLYTDHQALLKVLESEDITGRISRWQLALSEYDLDIYHVPGKDLAVADGLSRIEGYPSRIAIDEDDGEFRCRIEWRRPANGRKPIQSFE